MNAASTDKAGTVGSLVAIVLFLSILLTILPGCGVKSEQLPMLEFPYVTEIEFLKEVKNIDGKAKKRRFKRDRITSPFYFFLKVKEIENKGTLTVAFYSKEPGEEETKTPADSKQTRQQEDVILKKQIEKSFDFGKSGGYYEYIIFFDRVEGLKVGTHQYAVFMNEELIYEGQVKVNLSE